MIKMNNKVICTMCNQKFLIKELFSFNNELRCPVCGKINCFIEATGKQNSKV